MRLMRVKPTDGKKIRDPKNGRVLSSERSIVVPYTSYWRRRLKDKDIYEVSEKVEKPKPKIKVKKSEKVEKKEEKRDNLLEI